MSLISNSLDASASIVGTQFLNHEFWKSYMAKSPCRDGGTMSDGSSAVYRSVSPGGVPGPGRLLLGAGTGFNRWFAPSYSQVLGLWVALQEVQSRCQSDDKSPALQVWLTDWEAMCSSRARVYPFWLQHLTYTILSHTVMWSQISCFVHSIGLMCDLKEVASLRIKLSYWSNANDGMCVKE